MFRSAGAEPPLLRTKLLVSNPPIWARIATLKSGSFAAALQKGRGTIHWLNVPLRILIRLEIFRGFCQVNAIRRTCWCFFTNTLSSHAVKRFQLANATIPSRIPRFCGQAPATWRCFRFVHQQVCWRVDAPLGNMLSFMIVVDTWRNAFGHIGTCSLSFVRASARVGFPECSTGLGDTGAGG